MPPPRFISCQLCGQQFGSASIGIHIPQCQTKMLGRWQNMDPKTRGAPPMLRQAPALGGGASRGAPSALDKQPVGGRGRAVAPSVMEYDETPQLRRCGKCGRGFAFDRVGYHESVCKGNAAPRSRYNSSMKRAEGFNGGDGGGMDGGAFPTLKPFRKPGARGGASSVVPVGRSGNSMVMKSQRGGYTTLASAAPPNKTNWRSQHNDFISMIRDAKKYAPPPRQAPQPPIRAPRQPFQGSTTRNIVSIRQQATGGGGYGGGGGGGYPSHQQSSGYGGGGGGGDYGTSSSRYGSGGGGSSYQRSTPRAPSRGTSGGGGGGGYRPPSTNAGQRAFGSTTGRWEGRSPGAARSGGGGGSIAMSNETSEGMRQAFGRHLR